MFKQFRSALSSWWIKLLLALISLSMVSFYGFFGSSALKQNIVAEVGSEEISFRDFNRAYQNFMEFQKQFGLDPSKLPESFAERMKEQVLETLIQEKLRTRLAENMGFATSPLQIRESIKSQFRAGGGQFSFDQYKQFLEYRLGMSPSQFEAQEGKRLLGQNVTTYLQEITTVSEVELRHRYVQNNTQRKISFYRLSPQQAPKLFGPLNPSSEALTTYFEANKTNYEIPETREAELRMISLSDIIPEPSDEELKRLMASQFSGQIDQAQDARIHYSQLALEKANPQARALMETMRRQAVASGSSIESVLAQNGNTALFLPENNGDQAYVAVSKLSVPIRSALEGLKIGDISSVIEVNDMLYVFQVNNRIAAGEFELARLRPELNYTYRKQMLTETSQREALIKTAREKVQEDAFTYSQVISLNKVDQSLDATLLPFPQDRSIILGKIRTTEKGANSDLFNSIGEDVLYQVHVSDIIPQSIPEFSEVRDRVQRDWSQEAYNKNLTEFVTNAQVGEAALQQAIAKLRSIDLPQTTSDLFSASSTTIDGLGSSSELIGKAFSAEKGAHLTPTPIEGDWIFAQVAETVEPDWTLYETERDDIAQELAKNIANQKVSQLIQNERKSVNVQKSL